MKIKFSFKKMKERGGNNESHLESVNVKFHCLFNRLIQLMIQKVQ